MLTSIVKEFSSATKGLKETGFFHIVGASTLNRILALAFNLVLVRILSQDEYGTYAYALNIASFFVIFNGLGVVSAILQICSEKHQKQNEADGVYAYAYLKGVQIDVVLAILMLIVSLFVPFSIPGSNRILLCFCLYPLAMLLFDIKVTRLRVLLKNKEYAFATVMQTIAMIVLSLIGVYAFQVIGLVVGQSLSYFLVYVLLCFRYPFRRGRFSKREPIDKRDFWGISLISAFNNGLSQALTLVGTFLVGLLLASKSDVALYQAAIMVPFGLLFIPAAIVTYIYPYFARKRNDKDWTIRNYRRITFAVGISMGIVSVLICLLAGPLVLLLFGGDYAAAASPLRIMMIAFFLASTFRQIPGNLLVTQRKLRTNTCIGVLTILVNIAAAVTLIPQFGINGAAWSYVAAITVNSICNTVAYVGAVRRL